MSDRFVQVTTIPARKVSGLMAIVTVGSSEVHRLNELGSAIWERCEPPGATVDELVDALLPLYEVAETQLRADVLSFLAEATEKKILTVSS
jgi:hypothetical protein